MLCFPNMSSKRGSRVRGPDDGTDADAGDGDVQDRVFKALASPTRRRVLDLLKDGPRTTGDLCEQFPALDRCTVMQHLRVLEEAGLLIPQRRGRERWNHLDPLPIKLIHDRWIGEYAAAAVGMLADWKAELESAPGR
jgi:DNA-binding transcriptional ArsR family regulator